MRSVIHGAGFAKQLYPGLPAWPLLIRGIHDTACKRYLNECQGGDMSLETLNDLLIDQLNDLFDAERQVIDAVPRLADASSSSDLKRLLDHQLRISRDHLERLQQIFSRLGVTHDGEICEGMHGLIRDADRITVKKGDPQVKDAALITTAQRLEQYELTGYAAVKAYVHDLGYPEVEDLVEDAIREERELDQSLTMLSEGRLYNSPFNGQTPT
jgi:ferritin-like metal-binding protein YciE